MKSWLKEHYLKYKDFFPADLWAIIIMLLILIIGMILVL